MSVTRKLLLGLGGAAMAAVGLASTANAQVVATAGSCELYAREYAAVHAPRFGLAGWNTAYRYAFNECTLGGPTFVSVPPYPAPAYSGPFSAFGRLLTAPVVAAANVAGAAVSGAATVAGAVVSAPAAIAGAAVAPIVEPEPVVAPAAAPAPIVKRNYRGSFEAAPVVAAADVAAAPVSEAAPVAEPVVLAPEPVVAPAAAPAPVVTKNYRGTYETAPVVAVAEVSSTSALAVPAATAMPAQFTPEWHAYCAAKYVSYNPDTGMYVAYSGAQVMCN
jgi:hypothetical protein